jgi:hypothetical protein
LRESELRLAVGGEAAGARAFAPRTTVTSGESTSICGIAGSSCLPSFMWAVSREDDMALAAAGGADDALR